MKILFPEYRAVVLQDGHVDHISGPRCIVKMEDGPQYGRYQIAQTESVLTKGTPVIVSYRCGYPIALASLPAPQVRG